MHKYLFIETYLFIYSHAPQELKSLGIEHAGMLWNYNRMETLHMLRTGGIVDLQLVSTVQQQEILLGLREADPMIPDISSLPVNPFEEDEGQGYDSRRAAQRVFTPLQRRADGEEASRNVLDETAALKSRHNLPAPEIAPLPYVRNIPTSWRTCSPKGISQPLEPPLISSWCAPEFLKVIEGVEQKEKESGVVWDEVSPEEQFDIEVGNIWASQTAQLGMTIADAEAAASLVTLGGGSKSGMYFLIIFILAYLITFILHLSQPSHLLC